MQLIDRARNILLTPKTEWPLIEAEPTSIAQLFKGYVMPFAALYAVMAFFRMSIIGYAFWRIPLLSRVVYALVDFGLALLGVYLLGLIVDGLAPSFAGQRNQRQAMKTVGYAFTSSAVASVFGLLPRVGPLLQLLAGLYGIYLLYLGLPSMMRNPQEKSAGYTAVVVVCTILVFIVLGLLASVTGGITGHGPLARLQGFQNL
ncbi:MAG TPA: Yip1 family protein [Steroidobacteraceae bacterium]|nr:Yip1 family protein [Steroidobacteraceae bacterium]